MVGGGPGSPSHLPGARHYSRGVLRPSSLSRALAVVATAAVAGLGPALAGLGGTTAHAAGRPAARPVPAARAPHALDHPRLHPRPRPDRHPRHDHQRLRRGVDRDQRRGLRRLDPDHHHRRARRGRARPRSPPTSATGSPTPAPSTPSPPCSPADGRVHGQAAALEDRGLGARRLLVRRPRPGRDRLGTQRQRGGPRPHVPPARAASATSTSRAGGTPHSSYRSGPASPAPPTARSRRSAQLAAAACASGALHDVVSIGAAAHGLPLTWVVDPAVADVVRRLAAATPRARSSLRQTRNPGGSPSPSPSAGASASDSARRDERRRARASEAAQRGEALAAPASTRSCRSAPARSSACRTATSRSTPPPATTGPC